MTDCERFQEQMSAMLDGELPEEQASELRTHIESCEECRRVYDAFAGISGALSKELVEPPEMLAKGVMYRISLKKKGLFGGRFGYFTAIAASLVLIIYGASHYGLIGGGSSSTTPMAVSASPEVSDAQNYSLSAPVAAPETTPEPKLGKESGESANTTTEDAQATLASGGTTTESSPESTTAAETYQYGFPSSQFLRYALNAGGSGEGSTPEASEEPKFIFTATEISVYEGKYYTEADKAGSNKLLISVNSEDNLSSITTLVAADSSADYSNVNTAFTQTDPAYTLCVPADKENDENTRDELISVWFVDTETWCVVSGAVSDGSEAVKTLYKAVGTQDELAKLIEQLKTN